MKRNKRWIEFIVSATIVVECETEMDGWNALAIGREFSSGEISVLLERAKTKCRVDFDENDSVSSRGNVVFL